MATKQYPQNRVARNAPLHVRLARYTAYNPQTGCHEWTAAKAHFGYGKMFFEGKYLAAHRVAWELANGQAVAAGKMVCHTCDNPACVTDDHLFLGSAKENMDDMHEKGRAAIGKRHGMVKLTDRQALSIRGDKRKGVLIAREYGISPATVCNIRRVKRWKHL